MSSMVTSIVMELVDRVTRPARRIQQTLSGLGRKAGLDRLANSARRVGATVGTSIERLRSLTQGLAVMSGAVAGAVWGTERLVSGVTDVGTAVQESAERLGVGTTWLQEWQSVGRRFGVQNDALADGLKELGLRADEFVMTAGGPAAEAFGRLGIGIEELRKTGGRTEALFDLVRGRLGEVQNMAARQRIFDEIFGGQGGEQMVAMLGATREEVEAIMRSAQQRGEILSPEEIENSRKYTNQMGDLRKVLFGIQTAVVGELLPAINGWIERMGLLGQVNRKAVASDIVDGIRNIWRRIEMVGSAVSWAAERVGGFGNLLTMLAGLLAGRFLLSIVRSVGAVLSFGKELALMAARAIPAAIAGIRALSLALLTTPVGWIITAITAVAGAVYLIYRHWDSIGPWFQELWEGITAWFTQGIGGIMRDLASWSPAGLLLRAIDEIFNLFGARPLTEVASEWIDTLLDGVANAWEALPTWVEGRFEALREIFASFSLGEIGGAWIDSLRTGIAEEWEGLTNWLSSKIDGLTAWLPDWVKDGLGIEGAPQASGSPEAALGAPVGGDRQAALPAQARADVGGELRIVVDSEGRPRVAEARRNGGMDFNVESGMLGVMP
ncbi:hypothetical protein GCM10007160_25470 [Litchfieldella qijiaojingensis]|uniref:Phage tail tape measure protein n=1 Tax=Litchfieldella qijiaojingensis TaxID=980347 RepID=A0ABQ2YVJ9_9GAMM|nr:hypothetical protein [Halomonas qijiaojingensis]GGX96746.1 hypothetical protein GCM10007160_25470 [Halomonas qijiaojingensis]